MFQLFIDLKRKKQLFILAWCLSFNIVFAQSFIPYSIDGLPQVSDAKIVSRDFDADGQIDLLILGKSGINNNIAQILFKKDADYVALKLDVPVLNKPEATSLDCNNDKLLDIIVSGYNAITQKTELYFFVNYGNGEFKRKYSMLDQSGVIDGAIVAFDADMDADEDVFITGKSINATDTLAISNLFVNNNGEFTLDLFYTTIEQISNSDALTVDLDLNGANELLQMGTNASGTPVSTRYSLEQITYAQDSLKYSKDSTDIANGTIEFSRDSVRNYFAIADSITDLKNPILKTFDMDADGWDDVVVSGQLNDSTSLLQIYKNVSGTLTKVKLNIPVLKNASIELLDYDQDGDGDIWYTGFASNPDSCKILLYENQGVEFIEKQSIFGFKSATISLGYLNNDLKLDVLITGKNLLGYDKTLAYVNHVATANTAPTIINNLTKKTLGGNIYLSWSQATDTQQQSKTLRYRVNLYKNLNHNLLTSTNLDFKPSQANQIKFRNVLPGKYYIEINAYDNQGILNAVPTIDSVVVLPNNVSQGPSFTPKVVYQIRENVTDFIFHLNTADLDADGDYDVLLSGNQFKGTRILANVQNKTFYDCGLKTDKSNLQFQKLLSNNKLVSYPFHFSYFYDTYYAKDTLFEFTGVDTKLDIEKKRMIPFLKNNDISDPVDIKTADLDNDGKNEMIIDYKNKRKSMQEIKVYSYDFYNNSSEIATQKVFNYSYLDLDKNGKIDGTFVDSIFYNQTDLRKKLVFNKISQNSLRFEEEFVIKATDWNNDGLIDFIWEGESISLQNRDSTYTDIKIDEDSFGDHENGVKKFYYYDLNNDNLLDVICVERYDSTVGYNDKTKNSYGYIYCHVTTKLNRGIDEFGEISLTDQFHYSFSTYYDESHAEQYTNFHTNFDNNNHSELICLDADGDQDKDLLFCFDNKLILLENKEVQQSPSLVELKKTKSHIYADHYKISWEKISTQPNQFLFYQYVIRNLATGAIVNNNHDLDDQFNLRIQPNNRIQEPYFADSIFYTGQNGTYQISICGFDQSYNRITTVLVDTFEINSSKTTLLKKRAYNSSAPTLVDLDTDGDMDMLELVYNYDIDTLVRLDVVYHENMGNSVFKDSLIYTINDCNIDLADPKPKPSISITQIDSKSKFNIVFAYVADYVGNSTFNPLTILSVCEYSNYALTEKSKYQTNRYSNTENIITKDLDQDGDIDVIMPPVAGAASIFVYENIKGTLKYKELKYEKLNVDNSGNTIYQNEPFPDFNDIDNHIFVMDLNSDGLEDVILKDSVKSDLINAYINQGNFVFRNDGLKIQEINANHNQWAAVPLDYNDDKKLDVFVVSSDYKYENGEIKPIYFSYLNINQSKLQFEPLLTGSSNDMDYSLNQLQTIKVGDFDNDGKVDVLPNKKLLKNDVDELILDPYFGNENEAKLFNRVADFDNDGDLDIISGYHDAEEDSISMNYFTQWEYTQNNAYIANQKPNVPINTSKVFTDSITTLRWDYATDDLTASKGLTYNVELIALNSNKDTSIVVASFSHSSTGARIVNDRGNCFNNTYKIKNLKSGMYLWRVQAIDHGYAASAFTAWDTLRICNKPTKDSSDYFYKVMVPEYSRVGQTLQFSCVNSPQFVSYNWSFTQELQTYNTSKFNIVLNNIGFQELKFSIRSDLGCTYRDTITFMAGDELLNLKVTNLLTPNADGKNDFLKIENIERYPNNRVTLYNSWGKQLFTKSGYVNDWDLQLNGTYVDAGNYLCVVELLDFDQKIEKIITILK